MNLIDTAQPYGESRAELLVGQAAKGRRNKAYLATKAGSRRISNRRLLDFSPSSIRDRLEGPLTHLGTDEVDPDQVHWPDCAPLG